MIISECPSFGARLERVLDKVFFLNFTNHYDMAMCFLRYQEYYESPNPDFYRSDFKILDFMEWYAKNQSKKGIFSYPDDWAGFNIPSFVFNVQIFDPNKYDAFMQSTRKQIRSLLKKEGKSQEFYLIDSVGISGAFEHELAHGLYYTNAKYQKAVATLLKKANKKIINATRDAVREMMYSESVVDDEVQAYLSTGLMKEMSKIRGIKSQSKEFIKNFKRFKNLSKIK